MIHIPARLATTEAEFWLEQTLVPVSDAGVDHVHRIVSLVQALLQQAESLGDGQLGFDGLTRLAAIRDPLIPGGRIQPLRNRDAERIKLPIPPGGL